MLITQIRDRKAAHTLLRDLTGLGRRPTERTYTGYMLFLAGAMDAARATLLLESLRDLDIVTGPYIAGFIVVDAVAMPVTNTLYGFPPQSEDVTLTLPQIEGLCQAASLNHVQLDELKPRDLASATEHMARALGVVDRLPCIVIVDAVETITAGRQLVVEFPRTEAQLREFMRQVSQTAQSTIGDFRILAGLLERIHELHDRSASLSRLRGAPLARKRELIAELAVLLGNDPKAAARRFRSASGILGECAAISPANLHWFEHLDDASLAAEHSAQRLTRLAYQGIRAAGDPRLVLGSNSGDEEPADNEHWLRSARELRAYAANAHCLSIIQTTAEAEIELAKIEHELQSLQGEVVVSAASLSSAVERVAQTNELWTSWRNVGATIAQVAKKELSSASSWLKLFALVKGAIT